MAASPAPARRCPHRRRGASPCPFHPVQATSHMLLHSSSLISTIPPLIRVLGDELCGEKWVVEYAAPPPLQKEHLPPLAAPAFFFITPPSPPSTLFQLRLHHLFLSPSNAAAAPRSAHYSGLVAAALFSCSSSASAAGEAGPHLALRLGLPGCDSPGRADEEEAVDAALTLSPAPAPAPAPTRGGAKRGFADSLDRSANRDAAADSAVGGVSKVEKRISEAAVGARAPPPAAKFLVAKN